MLSRLPGKHPREHTGQNFAGAENRTIGRRLQQFPG